MTNPHTTPPDGARFIMLQLDSGREVVGWHDRMLGFLLKNNIGEKPTVVNWRELTETERNHIGLNE